MERWTRRSKPLSGESGSKARSAGWRLDFRRMRQKLAVAMACSTTGAARPDEPTTGIDPLSRVELWELIARSPRAARRGFATSYVDEAERASRVLVLSEGRALAAGAPET